MVSLYIHMPWCVQKCPYCDFNSHTLKTALPEADYIQTLLHDFAEDLPLLKSDSIKTIFIGGGTPSLFSPDAFTRLFEGIDALSPLDNDIEITMEANPGTVEHHHFAGFRKAGINRLSLGIQSFNDQHLKVLGRIHDGNQAKKAFYEARNAGFDNINLDLMFGLPQQTLNHAMHDLEQAIECKPEHLSWYQLTLEPNTAFYHQPPSLPEHDDIFTIQTDGKKLLANHQYQQYEISAYSEVGKQCQHNLNYWLFGDYLGIGAGAHGKIGRMRYWRVKHPKQYLSGNSTLADKKILRDDEMPIEFMMNALRLNQAIDLALFEARTGIAAEKIEKQLEEALQNNLIIINENKIIVSEHGHHYLNELLQLFIP